MIQHIAKPTIRSKHVVIGGGVVGLAVGARLKRECPSHFSNTSSLHTIVLEKNRNIGEETSSRNSEVIHAGIYYPVDSLKTRLCLDGVNLLYKYCQNKNVKTNRVGKWIVSTDDDCQYLLDMKKRTDSLIEKGSDRLYFLSDQQMKSEPHVMAKHVLFSPRTGIIDSHSYMDALRDDILTDENSIVQCQSKVLAIEYSASQSGQNRYRIHLDDCVIEAECVVNCAGLYCEHVARMLWRNRSDLAFPDIYRVYYYKGQYFSYSPHHSQQKASLRHLVYPIPDPGVKSLGIHATIDLSYRMKFGPDIHFLRAAFSDADLQMLTDDMLSREESFDYKVNPTDANIFHSTVRTYMRNIEKCDLVADYSGIRPKLNFPEGAKHFQDFVIQEESKHGFPSFINLMGIESPGLTSSLSIANYVAELLGYSKHRFE